MRCRWAWSAACVFAPEGEGQAALGEAAVRLERFVGDRHVGVAEGRAWARAAEQVGRAAAGRKRRAACSTVPTRCCATCASASSRT